MSRASDVRDRSPAAQFFDLDFKDFVRDPLGQIEEIYAYFDIPSTESARSLMSEWSRARPKDTHGSHEYNAEQFGLSAEMIRDRFKDYRQRHGLA